MGVSGWVPWRIIRQTHVLVKGRDRKGNIEACQSYLVTWSEKVKRPEGRRSTPIHIDGLQFGVYQDIFLYRRTRTVINKFLTPVIRFSARRKDFNDEAWRKDYIIRSSVAFIATD